MLAYLKGGVPSEGGTMGVLYSLRLRIARELFLCFRVSGGGGGGKLTPESGMVMLVRGGHALAEYCISCA